MAAPVRRPMARDATAIMGNVEPEVARAVYIVEILSASPSTPGGSFSSGVLGGVRDFGVAAVSRSTWSWGSRRELEGLNDFARRSKKGEPSALELGVRVGVPEDLRAPGEPRFTGASSLRGDREDSSRAFGDP